MNVRREDVPMLLAGLAAVCTPVSIAGFEILMGLAAAAMFAARQTWRTPPVLVPLGVFFGWTMISLAAHSSWRLGYPQVKKFYVFLMLFLVVSAFRQVRQIQWIAWGWALAASLSAAWAINQFYNKVLDAKEANQDFYALDDVQRRDDDRADGAWRTCVLHRLARLEHFADRRRDCDCSGLGAGPNAKYVAWSGDRGRLSDLALEAMGADRAAGDCGGARAGESVRSRGPDSIGFQPARRAGFERASRNVPRDRVGDDQGASAAWRRSGRGGAPAFELSAAGHKAAAAGGLLRTSAQHLLSICGRARCTCAACPALVSGKDALRFRQSSAAAVELGAARSNRGDDRGARRRVL